MSYKERKNVFKFSLTQGNVLMCEKIFNADNFNPFTRYSVDVRDILPNIIISIQKMLSRNEYDDCVEVGSVVENDGIECVYDLRTFNQNFINSFPTKWRNELRYNPKSVTQYIKSEDMTIRGVPCKIGLYINDNPIVEREFFVDGFNPDSLSSVDIVDLIIDITDEIESKIRVIDLENMWDDYDLINLKRFTINQIRELHPIRRREILKGLRRN